MFKQKFMLQIILLAALLLVFVPIVSAESQGCASINSGPNTVWPNLHSFYSGTSSYTFDAGDTIIYSLQSPRVWVYIGGFTVPPGLYVDPGSEGTGPISGLYTFTQGGEIWIDIGADLPHTTFNVVCIPAGEEIPAVFAPPSCPVFYDGRINNCDTGNWIVIYGHDYDSGRGLLITDTEGVELLYVLPEHIAAVAECPETNTLIASGNGVSVYRLANTCEYQVNGPAADGKTYVMIFNELFANAGYSSHEE